MAADEETTDMTGVKPESMPTVSGGLITRNYTLITTY